MTRHSARMRTVCAALVSLAVGVLCAALAAMPANAQEPPPQKVPLEVRPWRGTAPLPPGTDTLDVHSILQSRSAAIDSALLPETTSFDTLGLDSLVTAIDRGGAVAADSVRTTRRRRARRTVSFEVQPGVLSTYDRVNGFRLGSGGSMDVGRWLHADVAAAWAFSSNDWAGRARTRIGNPDRAIEAGWSDMTVPFGPNQGAHWTSVAALVAGQDRQEYARCRSWHAGLGLQPLNRSRLTLRYVVNEDEVAPAVTDFHFFGGGTPIEQPNPAIDEGTTRGIELGLTWNTRHERVTVEARGGVAGGDLGGDFDFAWQEGSVEFKSPMFAKGIWRLNLGGAHVTQAPPSQAIPYLGGDGNLRGYAPLEYAGDTRMTVRGEYAFSEDLFAKTGVRGLRALRLQFIPFVDAGTTWGTPASALGAVPLDGRWKSSVGLGIQRNLDYPGLGAVRLDVSRRTDGGPGGVGVWFQILDLQM